MSTVQVYSHEVIRNRQGTTATYTIDCAWADRATSRPKIGSKHPTEPNLYCTEVVETGLGKPAGGHTYTHCRIAARYSTFQQIEAAPTEQWEFGGEVLDTGIGRTWESLMAANDFTKCEQSFGVYYPNAIRTMTMVKQTVPINAIIQSLGKINWTYWQGLPAQTCLFEGASTESWFDYERYSYFYRISYRFLVRPISHNIVWRAPRQARNATGDLMWDADGHPYWELGAAGSAGWDKPFPPLYELGDFNPLFGWPPNPPPNRFLSSGGRLPAGGS